MTTRLSQPRKPISSRKRFSMPTNNFPNNQDLLSSLNKKSKKMHRSFSCNDIRHPLVLTQQPPSPSKILKRSYSAKAVTEKITETHKKNYKLKKKTFSEMKELLKDFNAFYKELKKLVSHVKFWTTFLLFKSYLNKIEILQRGLLFLRDVFSKPHGSRHNQRIENNQNCFSRY